PCPRMPRRPGGRTPRRWSECLGQSDTERNRCACVVLPTVSRGRQCYNQGGPDNAPCQHAKPGAAVMTELFGHFIWLLSLRRLASMEHRLFRSLRARMHALLGLLALLVAASTAVVALGSTGFAIGPAVAQAQSEGSGAAQGLGPKSGLLPRDHLTLESAIQGHLSKETVRLPLYKGKANGQTVWFVLLDASDEGLADDLGVNYAPKLSNLAIGCPECVQTVTLEAPTPAQNPFGQAVVNFAGAPDFSP